MYIGRMLLQRMRVPRDLLRFAFARYATRVALITPAGQFSYAELADRSYRLAQVMAAAEVNRLNGVLVWSACQDDLLFASLAALEHGCVLTALDAATTRSTVAQACQLLAPRLLLHDTALTDAAHELQALCPTLRTIAFGEELEQMLRSAPATPCSTLIAAEDLCGLGFTSGTTGPPKVLSATHGIQMTSLRLVLKNVTGIGLSRGPELALLGIPLGGAGSGLLLPTLGSGGTLVLPSRFDAAALARAVAQHRVTRLFTTPSLLIDLLDLPLHERGDMSSLRNLIYGTEWLPAAKIEEALRCFGPILQQGYGCAEVLPPVSMLQPADHWVGGAPAPRDVLSSAGRVVPQAQVRVLGEHGEVLPERQVGQIAVKSPTVFPGYWKRPDLSAQVLRDGWYRTGDMGYLAAGGWLHVLGRSADVIRRAGRTIYPRPIEEALHDHPAVKESALVQVGDAAVMAVSLRRVMRVAALDTQACAAELLAFLRQRIDPAQLPDRVQIMEELPRSALAKVLRREVRALLQRQTETTAPNEAAA